MTLPAPTYDLVILLDPQLEDSARAKIVADARSAIEAQAELVRHDEWGERALAYPIRRRTSAEYHLLQFRDAGAALLMSLDHSLRILDGILRFRIITLKPGVPEPPDMRSAPAPVPARRAEAESPAVTERPAEIEQPSAETERPAEAQPPAEDEAPKQPEGEPQAAPEAPVAEPA